jgi:hypothetical protein
MIAESIGSAIEDVKGTLQGYLWSFGEGLFPQSTDEQ